MPVILIFFRYSNEDKTTTFDKFGNVKTAEKIVLEKIEKVKQRGFGAKEFMHLNL